MKKILIAAAALSIAVAPISMVAAPRASPTPGVCDPANPILAYPSGQMSCQACKDEFTRLGKSTDPCFQAATGAPPPPP
jgi:hypothetical protein